MADRQAIYQIKVTLNGIRPPIWRRIQVPGNITFFKLHEVLQVVMGWMNYHLHQFTIDDEIYGDPAYDEYGDLGTLNEKEFRLYKLLDRAGLKFTYEYDFGDGWRHILLVENILPPEPDVQYPRVIAGKRGCPPEDVGGIWGYQEFLKAIRNPRHSEHASYLEWIGGEFDPEAFDLEGTNVALKNILRRSITKTDPWDIDEFFKTEVSTLLGLEMWAAQLSPELREEAAGISFARDVQTILAYIRDHKVRGTTAAGNFPLKAVREITARFVEPPVLDQVYGGVTFKLRTEEEIPELHFPHFLTTVGDLLEGGPGRLWKLTATGERFLTSPAAAQLAYLCYVWWSRINWLMVNPFGGLGTETPYEFKGTALAHLLAVPPGGNYPFELFAERLIGTGILNTTLEDPEYERSTLKHAIENMVIARLADFGGAKLVREKYTRYGIESTNLVSFQVTPFARVLLEKMAQMVG